MKNNRKPETKFIVCDCGSVDHLVMFSFEPEAPPHCPPFFYVNVLLNPKRNIVKRIWLAIRYVFGGRGYYGEGNFCEVVLSVEQAGGLREFLEL